MELKNYIPEVPFPEHNKVIEVCLSKMSVSEYNFLIMKLQLSICKSNYIYIKITFLECEICILEVIVPEHNIFFKKKYKEGFKIILNF